MSYTPPSNPRSYSSLAIATPLDSVYSSGRAVSSAVGIRHFGPKSRSNADYSDKELSYSHPRLTNNGKNVHFPTEDRELETVRMFNRSARPASLSQPPEDEDDDESESDVSELRVNLKFMLDEQKTSLIPALDLLPSANIYLESLDFSASQSATDMFTFPNPKPYTPHDAEHLILIGTVLVRNLFDEKSVAARFSFDDWQTTSEVVATYMHSLPSLPLSFTVEAGAGNQRTTEAPARPPWERFYFTIGNLKDYLLLLNYRRMFLAVRCTSGSDGQQEWWDNSGGKNYTVAFREITDDSESTEEEEEDWFLNQRADGLEDQDNNKESDSSSDTTSNPSEISHSDAAFFYLPEGEASNLTKSTQDNIQTHGNCTIMESEITSRFSNITLAKIKDPIEVKDEALNKANVMETAAATRSNYQQIMLFDSPNSSTPSIKKCPPDRRTSRKSTISHFLKRVFCSANF